MGQEKNAENIPFLRSTQPKSTERVPVVELSGDVYFVRSNDPAGQGDMLGIFWPRSLPFGGSAGIRIGCIPGRNLRAFCRKADSGRGRPDYGSCLS